MKFIASAFRYRVRDAAGGAAVFRGIVRGVYLKLTNCSLANNVVDAGASALLREERLIVVAAIDCIVVEQSGVPTEADQTKVLVRNRSGSEQSKIRPTRAIDWQLVNRSLVHITREILLRGVDDRRLGSHLNGPGDTLERQPDFQRSRTSNL